MARKAHLFVLAACLLASVTAETFKNGVYSVICSAEKKCNLKSGKVASNTGAATVNYDVDVNGWFTFEVVTDAGSSDYVQAYSAGYLEGALFTQAIYDNYQSAMQGSWNNDIPQSAYDWLNENDQWARQEVENCASSISNTTCDLWYQAGLAYAQMDGLMAGYKDYAAKANAMDRNAFLLLFANDDIGDIMNSLGFVSKPSVFNSHCSVLVKISQTTGELYHGHTTWGHYNGMIRVFKHYTMPFSHPSTSAVTVSMSSYPGTIFSGDDYFITTSGLIVTETTNDVFNMALYENLTPKSLLYWVRVTLANKMSSSGTQWTDLFAQYNSGTYNNQWQVTDTNLYTPGQPLQPNTLVILEQIPGTTAFADVTDQLAGPTGYFPSYNVPFIPEIYNMSGYPDAYAQYGDLYSYSSCPRANIFRRNQTDVQTFQDYLNLMRYNDGQHDPLSAGDPCQGAISARCDLPGSSNPGPFGGFDCKATTSTMIKSMQTQAISGPTTEGQPPFSWENWPNVPHYGQPTVFNFEFELFEPSM